MAKSTSPFDGVAWVTGASTGIGRQTALKLAQRGWRVVATARSADKLEELVSDAGGGYGYVIPMAGDVADSERMAAIVDEIERDHGGVGLAVLNAGIYEPMEGDELSVATFESTFDVNLKGTVNCLVPLSHAMGARERGQIALVSSVAGYGGLPTSTAYGATKAALINLAESLKFDFDKMGILIQVINPGFVDTPATKSNPFSMPLLMQVDAAADALIKGLDKGSFEVTFPKGFTYAMKVINLLPYWIYFPLMNRMTKWKERPLKGADANNEAGADEDDKDQLPIKRW